MLPNGPLLLLDASARALIVGVLVDSQWQSCIERETDALEGLFPLAEEAFTEASVSFDDLAGLIYCEGPGSLLGLRLAAMGINTWRQLRPLPLYTYRSLDALALALQQDGQETPFATVSDFRRGVYNHLSVTEAARTLSLREADELKENAVPMFHVAQRRLKASPPEGATPIDYRLSDFAKAHADFFTLQPHEAIIDAYVPQHTEYEKWSAQRHRGVR